MKAPDSLPVWAAKSAALLAQKIGLAPGSKWEPGIARYLTWEVSRLGDDPSVRGLVLALTAQRNRVSL